MKINEVFYSLQGEGRFTGVPAVFLRLSGCNLACPFCDTQHQAYTEMSEAAIVKTVSAFPARHIVITGGEPSMQLTDSLVEALHEAGFFIQIETNGTLPLPAGIDWVTCSPKEGGEVVLKHVDELKLLFPSAIQPDLSQLPKAKEYRLQPLDTGDAERNNEILNETINYILEHPQWNLSLQTHKILNVR